MHLMVAVSIRTLTVIMRRVDSPHGDPSRWNAGLL